MKTERTIESLRREYHRSICARILGCRSGGALNCADGSSDLSVRLAQGIADRIGLPLCSEIPSGQRSGKLFTDLTLGFLRESLTLLRHLRPGAWGFEAERAITEFDQYEHLSALDGLLAENVEARAAIGSDYLVKSDIVVYRLPLTDADINASGEIVRGRSVVALTPLRAENRSAPRPILHGSVSCKWTMRSDRAQNTRTEALNLIRNRKGTTPHIAAVTMEPMPSRLASIALGTGDIDCTYHAALTELIGAVEEAEAEDAVEMLHILVEGRRLRDIADLPFDLAA